MTLLFAPNKYVTKTVFFILFYTHYAYCEVQHMRKVLKKQEGWQLRLDVK